MLFLGEDDVFLCVIACSHCCFPIFISSFATKNDGAWSRIAFDNDLTPGFALIICLWGKMIAFV